MQRRLIVMRHAKSSWETPAITDHERPLNERGRRSAPLVGRELVRLGWQPQFILSSDSQRTRETAALLLDEWEEGIEARFSPNLYLAGPTELRDEIDAVSEEVEDLLVLGHNPGWEAVVHRLSGDSITMKTGMAALLQSECEVWADAFQVSWSLDKVVAPRELE